MRPKGTKRFAGEFEPGTPYAPNMCHLSGTYRIDLGDHFYFGSTSRLGSRVSQHRVDLEKGVHPNPSMQALFDTGAPFSAFLLMDIPRKFDDSNKDHRDRLEFREQLLLTQWFGHKLCLNRSSESGFNSDASRMMKEKWADPEFRRKMSEMQRTRARAPIGAIVKAKMSEAKLGEKNPNARSCTVKFNNYEFWFGSAAEAARHFAVTQQTMHQWLSGESPWPGSGPRKTRYPAYIGMSGAYEE